jgi:hypothetical protein
MSGARRWIIGGAGLAGLTAAVAAVSYPRLFRRACLTWGAIPEEVTGELPGDGLLAKPDIVTTRAITIDAPPSAIWPWLVQMGSGRGGVYTYDWIENLFGLGMHSADEILPQFQDLKPGDELPLGPGRPAMRVEVLEPERALTVRFEDGNWVWIFALLPDGGRTRLVSRNRIALPGARPPTRLFYMLVMEPGSLVMERKMLLGIKERAERLAGQRATPGPAGPAPASPVLAWPGTRMLLVACAIHADRAIVTSGRPAAR